MEMIMISDRKLKLILSAEDLDAFGVKTEDLDYANTETKRMLWDLLSQAKGAVGFQSDGYRILFQIFPCRTGGCEIFVSKLSPTERGREDGISEVMGEPRRARGQTERESAGRRGAFSFEELVCLLAVCRRLLGIGYGGESEAYIGDDRRYYLILCGMDATGYLPVDEFTFIREYGNAEPTEATLHFLSEHGALLCRGDAVEVLGRI